VSTKVPDVVARYFERDDDRDIDSIVDLFANDHRRRRTRRTPRSCRDPCLADRRSLEIHLLGRDQEHRSTRAPIATNTSRG
jgi:hypothetical protein